MLEAPGWWPTSGKANGDGDLVGDEGKGDGDGVRAKGESGIWPTDLRRFGSELLLVVCSVFSPPAGLLAFPPPAITAVAACSLCLRPWRVDGRW